VFVIKTFIYFVFDCDVSATLMYQRAGMWNFLRR